MTPKIYIPRNIYSKIMHWVNMSHLEVSGFGKVVYNAEGDFFTVIDAVLLKQDVGAAHTDIDPASLGKAMFDLKDQPGDLNFWWHSHVNMPVFWSGTDTATIRELGEQGYIVATVFNKKYEMRTAFCYKATTHFGTITNLEDELETVVFDDVNEADKAAWTSEFNQKVKQRSFPRYDFYSKTTEEDEEETQRSFGSMESEDLGINRLRAALNTWSMPPYPKLVDENIDDHHAMGVPYKYAEIAAVLGIDANDVTENYGKLTDLEKHEVSEIIGTFWEFAQDQGVTQ